jgi:gliding motility-associated-like protein
MQLASAQLNLQWFDGCDSFANFITEPPHKLSRDYGINFKQLPNKHEGFLSVTDSFGNVLFELVKHHKRGIRSDDADTSFLQLFSRSGQKLTLYRLVGKGSWTLLSQPHFLRGGTNPNLFYIFFQVYHNSDFKSHLLYIRYDAKKEQLLDTLPNKLGKSISFPGSVYTGGPMILKAMQYQDGTSYLFRYNDRDGIGDEHAPELILYQVFSDTILEVTSIKNVLVKKDNQHPATFQPICFYHHKKALLFSSEDGVEKFSFGSGTLVRQLLLPHFLPSSAPIDRMVLSPNDSMLYFNVVVGKYEEKGFYQYGLVSSSVHKVGDYGVFRPALAPNGKIFTDRMIIQQPNLPYPDCYGQNGTKKYYDCADGLLRNTYDNSKQIELNNYVWFKYQFTCEDSIKLINRSDSIFIDFEWTIENTATSSTTILKGANHKIATKNGDELFVVLKGTAKNGHSLFFSAVIKVERLNSPILTSNLPDSVCRYGNYVEPLSLSFNIPSEARNQFYSWLINGAGYKNKEFKTSRIRLKPTQEGEIKVHLNYKDGQSCELDSTVSFYVKDAPKAGFELSDSVECAPYTLNLVSTDSGDVKEREFTIGKVARTNAINWSDTFLSPTQFKITQTLTGPTGCITKDSQWVRIRPGFTKNDSTQMLTASVLDSHLVLLKWKTNPNAMGYSVIRQQKGQNFWPVDVFGHAQDSIIDTVPLTTRTTQYQYFVRMSDSCFNMSKESNHANTIVLSRKNYNNQYVVLTWNAYEKWYSGVKEYVIESSENKQDWLPIDASGQLSYPDYRLPQLQSDTVYYRIKAIEQNGNQQHSYSNVVKVPINTTLFIPNAFSPNGDGINDIFKIGHFGLKEFECKIYSSTGQIVSYSTNPDAIWDGEFNELPYPMGNYRYVIKAIDQKGKELYYEGTLVLIR